MDLQGKLALITGSASGIGRETAIELSRKGCTCVLVDVQKDKLADVLEEVRKYKPASTSVICDISDGERVRQTVQTVHEQYGYIDILVNNAAVMVVKLFEDMPEDEFHRQLDVNFYGSLRLIRTVVPIMQSRGRGVIINVASLGGRLVVPGTSSYAASKAALQALSESLHYELKDKGIHIGVVVPGGTRTGIFELSVNRLGKYYRDQSTTPPEKVARRISEAIEKERFVTYVPFSSRLLLGVHDAFPGIFSKMLQRRIRPYFK